MAPFDRPYDFLLSAIASTALSCDLEMWARGHSRSLKLVPFKSLSTVSYSPSIVTIISDIKREIGRKSIFFIFPCI